jgi:hypothetical protein
MNVGWLAHKKSMVQAHHSLNTILHVYLATDCTEDIYAFWHYACMEPH